MILLASFLNHINLGMGAGVGGDTTYKRKLKPHVAFRKTSLQLFQKNKHCYKKNVVILNGMHSDFNNQKQYDYSVSA